MTTQKRPLCIACRTAPAELNFRATAWKKRCAECQRLFERKSERQHTARRKARQRLAAAASG
jgi:hypothetical protein